MSTSTLFRCLDGADEDPDLQMYSRRISLRAPPLPNLVNISNCRFNSAHLTTRSPAPGLDHPTRTRGRLAPAHWNERGPSASEERGF